MTPGPDPQVNLQVVEQERRRLGQRLDEVSRLCEADVPPAVFYSEMLKRLLESLAAPAGAVWTRTPQGNLQIQYQVNLTFKAPAQPGPYNATVEIATDLKNELPAKLTAFATVVH